MIESKTVAKTRTQSYKSFFQLQLKLRWN